MAQQRIIKAREQKARQEAMEARLIPMGEEAAAAWAKIESEVPSDDPRFDDMMHGEVALAAIDVLTVEELAAIGRMAVDEARMHPDGDLIAHSQAAIILGEDDSVSIYKDGQPLGFCEHHSVEALDAVSVALHYVIELPDDPHV